MKEEGCVPKYVSCTYVLSEAFGDEGFAQGFFLRPLRLLRGHPRRPATARCRRRLRPEKGEKAGNAVYRLCWMPYPATISSVGGSAPRLPGELSCEDRLMIRNDIQLED